VSPAARALISDFGGVLTTPLQQGFLAYQDESGVTLEQLGMAIAQAAAENGENPLYALERGEISDAEFRRRVEAHLDGEVDLARLQSLYFAHIEPNPTMVQFVREVRDNGVRTALLTNNVREWEARWRSKVPEIDELFEVVVDSAFVGMRKPEPAIYELTVERLGVRAQQCVFVDDLEINCDAARALGMTAVRFDSAEQAIPELRSALVE
jgi:epoxide hydrolase-like predicted phosphatase